MNYELLKFLGFGEEVERVKKGLCPFCAEPTDASQFKDPLSLKEWRVSGMCQKCQDDAFGCAAIAVQVCLLGHFPAMSGDQD